MDIQYKRCKLGYQQHTLWVGQVNGKNDFMQLKFSYQLKERIRYNYKMYYESLMLMTKQNL